MKYDTILNGDCLELADKIPDNSVDLIATDPPYNISRDTKILRRRGKFGTAQTIDLDFGDWDHHSIMPENWIPAYSKKLKDNGVFITFYDKRNISYVCDILEELGLVIRHVAGWHKQNPAPQARKVKWQNALELFVIATKNKGTGHHYNYEEGQGHDVITTPICQGKERLNHPTQKPEALFESIIKWWSFEGDIVLDPFAGTGTTGIVAKKLGRKYVLIEKVKNTVNGLKADWINSLKN